jgi:hypothetical protein
MWEMVGKRAESVAMWEMVGKRVSCLYKGETKGGITSVSGPPPPLESRAFTRDK